MSTTTLTAPGTEAQAPRVPDAPRTSLARLTAVELRKTVDTRSGRWMLLLIGGLALAGLGWRLRHMSDTAITYAHWVGTAMEPVVMLLPALAVLALTSEWTQRTALTTFSLVPRRGRVLTAKLAATVLVAAAAVVLVAALSAVAVLVAGVLDGSPVTWGEPVREIGGLLVECTLYVLMGAGFGALLQSTPLALIAYFVAPGMWSMINIQLLGAVNSRWLELYGSVAALGALRPVEHLVEVVVSLAAWIVLPLVLGVLRSLRREVA